MIAADFSHWLDCRVMPSNDSLGRGVLLDATASKNRNFAGFVWETSTFA